MSEMKATVRNPRDFDCCAYRSKSGKTGCGALRWYHDDPVHNKRHKFVEPVRKQIAEEERDQLLSEVAELREALKTLRYHLQKQPDVVRLIDTALAGKER